MTDTPLTRVKQYLAAQAQMGDNVDKESIHDVWADPATERVPWWEALGERVPGACHPDGITIVAVGADDDGPWIKVDGTEYGSRLYSLVAPDGTVEVLARVVYEKEYERESD